MRPDYDVIVVGAGPGGSAASNSCAQRGLRTLLIEREHFPRHKVCGGCLSRKTVDLLGFDLTAVVENEICGARFTYCSKDPLLISSGGPIGYLVMRDRFDHLLVRKAQESGVEFLEGERVLLAEEREERIEIKLERREKLYCTYLVGADGAGSTVARILSGWTRPRAAEGAGVASETPLNWVPKFPVEERHFVHLDFGRIPDGYGWIFPKGEVLSIGVGGVFGRGTRPHRYLQDFIRGVGFLKGINLGQVVGHPIPTFYSEDQAVAHGNMLLVGDAAHMIDPLTGEGIYYAILTGLLAARAIIQSEEKGDPAGAFYQSAVREHVYQNLKWGFQLARIIYRFPRLSYRALKQYPELGQLCIQMLGGVISYQSFVVEVKERMKDLLGGKLGERIRRALVPS